MSNVNHDYINTMKKVRALVSKYDSMKENRTQLQLELQVIFYSYTKKIFWLPYVLTVIAGLVTPYAFIALPLIFILNLIFNAKRPSKAQLKKIIGNMQLKKTKNDLIKTEKIKLKNQFKDNIKIADFFKAKYNEYVSFLDANDSTLYENGIRQVDKYEILWLEHSLKSNISFKVFVEEYGDFFDFIEILISKLPVEIKDFCSFNTSIKTYFDIT